MSLKDWLRAQWLVEHESSREEARLDAFRKKRHIGDDEQAGLVSKAEANEMVALARQLREEVKKWLQVNHPELL